MYLRERRYCSDDELMGTGGVDDGPDGGDQHDGAPVDDVQCAAVAAIEDPAGDELVR